MPEVLEPRHTLPQLAERVGIALPSALQSLVARGLACYPPDYATDFVGIATTRPPAFASVYDFEWIPAADASSVVDEWLDPDYQNAARFLPFAQSGAGDAYCIVAHPDVGGVGLIPHDDDVATLSCETFDAFACTLFLDVFQDMRHLVEGGFSAEQATTCVRRDVEQVLRDVTHPDVDLLHDIVGRTPAHRSFKPAPKARPCEVLSFLSQEEYAHIAPRFMRDVPVPVPITARWDIP